MSWSLTRQPLSRQVLFIVAIICVLAIVVFGFGMNAYVNKVAVEESQKVLNEEIETIERFVDYAEEVSENSARSALSDFYGALGSLVIYGETEVAGGARVPDYALGSVRAMHNQEFLLTYQKRYPKRSAAFLVSDGTNFYRATTLLKDANGNYRDGELIKDAYVQDLLAGREYLGLIARSGKMYALAATPLKDASGRVVGGVTMRVSIEENLEPLKEHLRNMHVAQTGYIFILADAFGDIKEPTVALHPTLEGKTLGEIQQEAPFAARMIEEKSGTISYDWKNDHGSNDHRILAFRENAKLHWVIAVSSFLSEYTGVYDRLRHITLACFVVIGVLLTVLITALLGARLRPLQAVMQGLDAFGRGNLRTRIQVAEGSDNEIDRLALAVNRSAHSMGALVGSIRQTSSQVRDCAEDMNTSAEQLHGAVRTLSESACEMSANSQQLSSSIQQVSSSASSADELATQAVSEVNTGKQVTLEVIGFARNIEERVRSSLAEVERLNTMSQEINHALEAIRSVAEQTNLLALNAAIEAARAGEAGRGFAVVADEVRKLAGQSEQSTGEISNILNRVNSGIQSVQQTISGAAQEAVQSTEAAGRAEGALNSIEQITGEIAHAINAIAHSVQEQSKATSNVVQRLEHAAQITEEAGKTSANVAHSAEDLGHAAASLEENVGHFQT